MSWINKMFSQQFESELNRLDLLLNKLNLTKIGQIQSILIEDELIYLPEEIRARDFYGMCLQAFTKTERNLFYLIYTRHEDIYLREEAWRYLLRNDRLESYSFPFIYRQVNVATKLSRQLKNKIDLRAWRLFTEKNK